MYNYHNRKKFIYSIFLILLLVIGIGYAYLTSNLSISGNTNVTTNTWNIHFENIQVKDGSVTATSEPTLSNNNTSITYTIDLNRPKEYYEFTVDVKNDGTLPGKVSISELSGITIEAQSIIDYSVTYINGRTVAMGDILNAGAKKSIKVRVFYKDEINPSDFPANDLNLTLTYMLQYVQSEEEEKNAGNLIKNLAKTESCITKYEGAVTDQVGITVPANNVYFDKCADKRNVIFGGFCWQMIRTTETGGIKMIYNGEPDDEGHCGLSRTNHLGIVGRSTVETSLDLSSAYLYGSSFSYNTSTEVFTLIDTETYTWNDNTYENIIGKYTCKSNSDTCTSLYSINGFVSDTNALALYYKISSTNYAQIGVSSFNSFWYSPAMVGYMFNKVYPYNSAYPSTNEYKYGNSFVYDSTTDTYNLSGTTQNISDWNSNHNTINNTHYTCWNTTGSCNKISYIFFTDLSNAFYIILSGGRNIDDALDEMLYNDDVNRYNSSIKGIIDSWYAQNLSSKTYMLEDAVYCNARNITSINGWNPNGGDTEVWTGLVFNNRPSSGIPNLVCSNETDQFTVSNNKAKLTYPIALLQEDESVGVFINSLLATGDSYWEISPDRFTNPYVYINHIASDGDLDYEYGSYKKGIRPVISLASFNTFSTGSGSEMDPWIVDE